MDRIRATALKKTTLAKMPASNRIARIHNERLKLSALDERVQDMRIRLNMITHDIRTMRIEYSRLLDEIITAKNSGNTTRLRDLYYASETMKEKIEQYLKKLDDMINQEEFKQLMKRSKILTQNIEKLKGEA